MVGKLFNDLVTALDIIPSSSTVHLCVHHPSTCALSGKVRVLAKRPCIYKSLVLTVTGTTRICSRQGSRTIKAKQVFLNVSKEILFEGHSATGRRNSALAQGNAETGMAPRDSPNTEEGAREREQSPSGTTPASPPSRTQNQLLPGVNDIDFRIEFPSHIRSKASTSTPSPSTPSPQSDPDLCSLPSGPMKTTAGDSSIMYTLRATLVLSRRDILVNNHMTATTPFRVQSWQDTIDYRQSEDHSFHGKRRGKIEFQFQVPKQLDLRRLQELQFGFKASWRTLQDQLKVKEVQYYIVEEEHQLFGPKVVPIMNTSIISTSALHDCSSYTIPTNTWGQLRAAARLQIPQPNTVLETTTLPWPHTLSVSHKLRVLIKFDRTFAKERDLQLSFPILIHPTLEEDGAPVHQDMDYRERHRPRRGSRRRRSRALYGIVPVNQDDDEDGYDEDSEDEVPLPVYADRDSTLLLMVGEEVQMVPGLSLGLDETTMGMTYPNGTPIRSPSSDSSMPNSPVSPNESFPSPSPSSPSSHFLSGEPIRGEQHTWTTATTTTTAMPRRPVSLTPVSSAYFETALASGSAPRRHSTIEQLQTHRDRFLPPPYVMPSLEESPETAISASRTGSLSVNQEVGHGGDMHRNGASSSDHGPTFYSTSAAGPSSSSAPIAPPSPPYEIQEEPLCFSAGDSSSDASSSSSLSAPSDSSDSSDSSGSFSSSSRSPPSPSSDSDSEGASFSRRLMDTSTNAEDSC